MSFVAAQPANYGQYAQYAAQYSGQYQPYAATMPVAQPAYNYAAAPTSYASPAYAPATYAAPSYAAASLPAQTTAAPYTPQPLPSAPSMVAYPSMPSAMNGPFQFYPSTQTSPG
eukprot:CAMPEP_0168356404 /NCGR_PEP_ID=MMETSP0228-20121227/13_1 /TAXON_ID=133427 /ORGANISM="Protoceratium reticulatum, Strain CCCM 535 (=CCMP 1889)" /LENGTH=113 /DNA_ID=CAMNT_0008368809 /DNA_START=100 /DNA_END=438 /DNA_ORIENTATION=-